MSKKTKEYRAQIAEQFIQILQEKELDWKRDWQINGMNHPVNGSSGYYYRGINRIHLALIAIKRGYQDPRWATFNQIDSHDWRLNNAKGQGVKVEYWYVWDSEEKKVIPWDEYRKIEEKENKYELRAKYTTVFNAELIQGIPPLPEPEKRETQVDQLIERISRNMGVEILNDGGERAFYSITEDRIHLPDPQIFYSDYGYNSTALHELSHATGAPHRLNRDLGDRFGSEKYAYEELVAEISSCFISDHLQIEQEQRHIDNHKAYVQSWIKAIREDPEILVKAVQEAEKAADYLEFKAELIEKKDYEKRATLSFEVKDNKGIEKTKDNGAISALAELQKTGNVNEWAVDQIDQQYRLTYHDREVLKGDEEEVLLAIERISHAQQKGATFGKILRELREKNNYSIAKHFAEIILVSDAELKLIEEGKIYPDKFTLQMIGNLCNVYLDDLDTGKIVPKRSREELQELLRELQQQIKEIQNDTIFFQEFIKKHNIPIEQESKDYYVIDDLKTGQTVQSLDHRELRIENQAAARHLANQLNQTNELTESNANIEEEKLMKQRESTVSLKVNPNKENWITSSKELKKPKL